MAQSENERQVTDENGEDIITSSGPFHVLEGNFISENEGVVSTREATEDERKEYEESKSDDDDDDGLTDDDDDDDDDGFGV